MEVSSAKSDTEKTSSISDESIDVSSEETFAPESCPSEFESGP